jgi:filamentous hemagglutinin family protein
MSTSILKKILNHLFLIYFIFFSSTYSYAGSIGDFALPTGGSIASGNITINQTDPGKLIINQTTNQGIINWQSFNVGTKSSVYFNTPGASAGVLNNISGGTSTILGSIFSNGRLFFTNPSGIIFGPGSQVKAEGLVASAMRISNQDFLNQNYNFTNNQIASLQNEGDLQAQYVALIAPQVSNKGTITTNVATLIAAGDDVKLAISDSNRLSVNINPSKIKTLSSNEGVIKSENGTVSIQANAAQELIEQTINAPRSADSLISENGVIKLVSNSGSIKAKKVNLSSGPLGGTEVAGTIDVSSNTKGGDIEITGKEIQVKSNSKLLATGDTGGGNILVGGDWQGSNGILQATYTTVEKDTLIDTSSLGVGDGGKIVVYSDIKDPNSKTIARGTFLALGGVNGGNGGNIETSGSSIDFEGNRIDTKAPKGNVGLWLIDPYNYTINSSAASAIVSALSSSNVTLTTSSNNTSYGSDANILSVGNIIVSSDIVSSSSNQLSLVAGRDITINSPIIISGSGSKIDLNALGGVTLNAKILATNLDLVSGQNVTLNSGLGITGTANITANSGLISFGSSFASNATYASSISYNFSSGMDGWTSGLLAGVNTWTLNDGALYNPNEGSRGYENSYVMSPLISTNAGSTIKFSSKTLNETGYYDREYLQYSTNNGASWSTLIDYTNSVWNNSSSFRDNISAVIPSSSSDARFRFQYNTIDGCCGTPGWWIKNIVVGADISGNLGVLNLSSNQVRLNSNVTTSGALTVNAPIQLLGNSQLSSSVASLNQNVNLSSYQLTLNNSSSSSSSGIISGTGSLVKSGLGALTLSGANEYIGNTTVSAGTLLASGTLSDSSQVSVASGATYQLGQNDTVGSIAGAGNINLGSNTLTSAGVVDTTFSGIISGTGVLTKSGAGTLTLSGANTYSGGTTLTQGQISLGINQSSQSSAGPLGTGTLIMNGGTLGNTSSYGTIYNNILANSGTTSILKEISGSNLYLGGNITGSGNLQVSNTSGWTVALAGDNSNFTGTYIQPSGTNGNTGFYSSSAGSSSASWELSAGRFVNEVAGGNISLGSLTSNATSGYLLGSSGGSRTGSYTIGGKNLDSSFSGTIENNYPGASNNTLSIIKTGSGTLTLSGNNTYSGNTTVSAGTLLASGTLSDSSQVSVASGATYQLGQNDTVGSIAGAGNINLGSNTLTSAGVVDSTFSGNISGTGGLTLTGSNNLSLSGANTYSGTTNINGGGLVLANTAALAANSITSSSGRFKTTSRISDLTVTGAVTLIGDVTTTGTQTYNNNVTIGAGSAANPLTISSQNSNINFLGTVKTGSGAKAAQRSLTVNAGTGNVTFNDRIGYEFNGIGFNPLLTADSPYALSVTGGNITLKGDVMTFETQTYNGAVKIGGTGSNGTTRTLLSMDPKITFNGTVDDTQANTHTLVAKAVQVRSNVLNSDVPEVNFNKPVSSTTKLSGYQGLTGYQIVSNEFGSIDSSISFGSVRLPSSSSSSSSSSSNSQAEQRNIENKTSSLKPSSTNSSIAKTGMTLSQMFNSFKPEAGTSFVKSIEIVYPDSPKFNTVKNNQASPTDAKSNDTVNQNQPNKTKPNNQPNQKQNSSGVINDDENL